MELIKGRIHKAKKVVCYGPEGIGKSTFASRFPAPIFIDVEGSTHEMDVVRVQPPSSWTMIKEQVQYFIRRPDELRTLVIDTADWAERMCVKHICDANDQKGVETFGYGKGYVYVYEEFGRFLNLLSELVDKGVTVVILAHATIRKFEQPDEMGSYDRYELKLTKKTGAEISAMLKEWSDMLLFANYKTYVTNVDGQGATKGKNKAQGGARVMYTTHTPSWDAKNRYGLPDELPFDYEAIRSIIEGQGASECGRPGDQSSPPPAVLPFKEEPLAKLGARTREAARSDVPATLPSGARAQSQESLPGDETEAQAPREPSGEPSAPALSDNEPQNDTPLAKALVDPPPTNIPKALYDLMRQDEVTEQEIMFAVAGKGYYPGDTPIGNYAPDFVQGVLIGAWPQVRAMVMANRENTPF